MEEKNPKKLFILKIIPFELGMTYSHNQEHDISPWQSICYKTPLRFNISLREILSKSVSFIVMKKYNKSVLMEISEEFWTL